LIFNEPDVDGQDRVSDAFLAARGESRAEYYARLIHTYSITVKSADPTAKLIGPNLFNTGGQARSWLSDVRNAYRAEFGADLPFDIIGVHLYAFDPSWSHLPQIDLVQNERYLADMLQFAAELPGSPKVWVTEFGSMWIYSSLHCAQQPLGVRCSGDSPAWDQLSKYTSQMVQDMSAAGVERWFQFSDSPQPDGWSDVPNATFLSTQDGELTPLGRTWLNLVLAPTDPGWATRVLNQGTISSATTASALEPKRDQ
jgi:hypothetical protein